MVGLFCYPWNAGKRVAKAGGPGLPTLNPTALPRTRGALFYDFHHKAACTKLAYLCCKSSVRQYCEKSFQNWLKYNQSSPTKWEEQKETTTQLGCLR